MFPRPEKIVCENSIFWLREKCNSDETQEGIQLGGARAHEGGYDDFDQKCSKIEKNEVTPNRSKVIGSVDIGCLEVFWGW